MFALSKSTFKDVNYLGNTTLIFLTLCESRTCTIPNISYKYDIFDNSLRVEHVSISVRSNFPNPEFYHKSLSKTRSPPSTDHQTSHKSICNGTKSDLIASTISISHNQSNHISNRTARCAPPMQSISGDQSPLTW